MWHPKTDQAPLQLPWFFTIFTLIDIISDQIFPGLGERDDERRSSYRLQMQVIILETGTGVVLAEWKNVSFFNGTVLPSRGRSNRTMTRSMVKTVKTENLK